MTSSEKLDLSRLPAFRLVEADFEEMLAEHLASLKLRLGEQGIAWDVGGLETDPFVILSQEVTYRRLLDLYALNDAGRAMTLAHAWGSYLDHLAATLFPDLNLVRMEGEGDERFRRRITLAPEARSAVTPGAYVFNALTSDIRISDAAVLNYASGLVDVGHILVAILPAEQHMDALEDLVLTAREAIMAPRMRLASEVITVRAASPTDVTVTGTLRVARGPDPGLVVAEAQSRLAAYRTDRRRIGRVLSRSGLMGALHAGGVEFVDLPTPAADVDPGPDGWVRVTAVDVTADVSP